MAADILTSSAMNEMAGVRLYAREAHSTIEMPACASMAAKIFICAALSTASWRHPFPVETTYLCEYERSSRIDSTALRT